MRVGSRPKVARPAVETRGNARAPSTPRAKPDAFERGGSRATSTAPLTRSTGPEGTESLVTAHESARARQVLAGPHGPALRAVLDGLSPVAHAVTLRVVAARANAFSANDARAALAEVSSFAARVRTLPDAEVLQRATALDLDSTRNDSPVDPQPWWDRRGTVRARDGDANAANNDGLFQRFTASCGTTVIQMMLAEADPAYALTLHDAGIHADSASDPTADFQRALLEPAGGIALGRREAWLRSRLRNGLARLGSTQDVTDAQARALLNHALSGGPRSASANKAVAALRARYDGFPSDTELKLLARARLPDRDEGLGSDVFLKAVHDVITPRTGVTYRVVEFDREDAAPHLDKVAQALERGIDVPFGTSEPAHWMMFSAVRGTPPARAFLVSDPDGGRTAWVSQRDLVRGNFARDIFFLPRKDERPYVDTFLLPV